MGRTGSPRPFHGSKSRGELLVGLLRWLDRHKPHDSRPRKKEKRLRGCLTPRVSRSCFLTLEKRKHQLRNCHTPLRVVVQSSKKTKKKKEIPQCQTRGRCYVRATVPGQSAKGFSLVLGSLIPPPLHRGVRPHTLPPVCGGACA